MTAPPSTGLVPVDEDHRKILSDLDDLQLLSETGEPPEELLKRFDIILEDTRQHFAREERIMDNIGFPLKPVHADEHRKLLAEVETFRTNVTLDMDKEEWSSVVEFLRHWFSGHIAQSDRKLYIYIHQGPEVLTDDTKGPV